MTNALTSDSLRTCLPVSMPLSQYNLRAYHSTDLVRKQQSLWESIGT